MTYEIINEGKESTYQWKGNKKDGEGSLCILELNPPSEVIFKLNFGNQNTDTKFIINKTEKGVEIQWIMHIELANNSTGRHKGLFIDNYVGKDYEKGLQQLKASIEKES